jgi:hypothetical protein
MIFADRKLWAGSLASILIAHFPGLRWLGMARASLTADSNG